MAALPAGTVVFVQFPFSDLSQNNVRPAVVIANAGRGDWVLCQITSQGYDDPTAIPLAQSDLKSGSLRATSFARPLKLVTASDAIFASQVGGLSESARRQITETIVAAVQSRA